MNVLIDIMPVKFYQLKMSTEKQKMNQIKRLEYQKAQVAKVLASHGADSDHLLNAVLVAKAMSLGIENPFAWATKMFGIIQEHKLDD